MDIVGIGDADVDLMIKVDNLPRHDEKVRGTLIGKFPGGIIGNFCSAAATLGNNTAIVAKLGKDEYGEICINDFINRGINTTSLIVDENCDTYFSIVHLDNSGEKALTIIQTNGFLPKKNEINIDFIKKAKYVHMTTLDVSLASYVFESLKKYNCICSIDIEPTASDFNWKTWEKLLINVDIAFPNEAGLEKLTGFDDVSKGAKVLLDAGVNTVVVTRGKKGVNIFEAGNNFYQPSFSVDVKDTTGAGDCFNAAFITAQLKGFDLPKSAKFAAAAAAISIGSVGARGGMPTYNGVLNFLHDQGEEL
jgi:sugar/nucleoside kinase (ribokinase family)